MDRIELTAASKTLGDCLEKKKALMDEIFEITLLQKKDILENGGENINSFLDQRQMKMDQVDTLDEAFIKVFAKIKAEIGVEDLGTVSGSQYPELTDLKGLIGEVQEITLKTLSLENEAEEELEKLMERVRKEMLMVQKGRRTLNAYDSKPQSNDGYFIDRKK